MDGPVLANTGPADTTGKVKVGRCGGGSADDEYHVNIGEVKAACGAFECYEDGWGGVVIIVVGVEGVGFEYEYDV